MALSGYSNQYRPLTTLETAADAGLSTRIQELANAVNIGKARQFAPAIIPATVFVDGTFVNNSNSTSEIIKVLFNPTWVPDGYNAIAWIIQHRHNSGTGTCTWRLYSSSTPYPASTSAVMDTTLLQQSYGVSATATASTTLVAPGGLRNLTLNRSRSGHTYLILTAQNSVAGASDYGILRAISAKVEF